MRETKNLKLTQFDPNDVPNWLDQYNTDMEKIDTANASQGTTNAQYESRFTTNEEMLNNNRTQINENTQDIANIKDDVKNIKGGSNVSIATLEEEVTGVQQSLTTLKGGSTRTIAEIDNDLNSDKAELSALDGRVETLEDTTDTLENDVATLKNKEHDITTLENTVNRIDTSVGTASVSNFGSDITTAIGNVDLKMGNNPKSISDSLNTMLNHNGALTFNSGGIGSLGGSANIVFAKNSSVCVPALLNMKIDAVSGTLETGTHVVFTAPLARLPKLKAGMFQFLFNVKEVLGMQTTDSTAKNIAFYLRTTTTTFDVILVITDGQFKFNAKNTGTLIFPVVLPVNPF